MKKVLINIKGYQTVDGDKDDIEITTVGKLEAADDLWQLTYKDRTDDINGETVTTLDVQNKDTVTLNRSGSIESCMTIQRGKRHTSLYSVGDICFTLGTFGELVKSDISENGGNIKLKYTIDINSNYASTNEIDISVREISQQ